MTLDRSKVLHAARNGIPLVIRTHTLPSQTESDLDEILGIFLAELGQSAVFDHLAYCLKELTGNAKKANTKRVYFEEKGLKLGDPADYALGMKTFKEDTLGNISHYLALQVEKDLHLKVSFLIRNQVLYLGVRNNVPIVPVELGRVSDRVARSRAFDSMEQAFEEVLDDTEGAGLGIVILVLMLRKMGLTERSFILEPLGQETLATLTIPMEAVKVEQVNAVSEELAAVIENLPPFPENVQNLLRLLDDPEVSFAVLAAELGRDPALTVDLLRFLHSAANRGGPRIDNLEEAVRSVGIQGLKHLVYPYGAHKVLETYLSRQRPLWENATRVAFYAAELAREFHYRWDTQGQAQVGGLLYNLGQIVLTFLHPDLSAKVLDFCRSKGFSIELFDALTQSINPADLGARIAQKWGFPADLVDLLANQNHPQGAPAALQPLVCLVHLAGSLRSVELDLLTYGQIHPEVLRVLGLTDPERLATLHDRVRIEFTG